jgi:hypothetical protein
MKLPDKIKGRNKIRDFRICQLYLQESLTHEELGQRFGLTQQRISKVLYHNRELLKLDKDHEKLKRIMFLKRFLEKHNDALGKKSSIDIINQLRVETEGERTSVEHSGSIGGGETKIYIMNGTKKDNARLPSDVKRIPAEISI